MTQPILLSSLLILSAASSAGSVIVTVSPLLPSIFVGSTATVQIGISGLGLDAAPSLGAYDLNLAFDPSILSFTGVTFGDPVQGDQLDLSGSGTISDFSNSPADTLEFFEISFDPATLLDTQQSDHFVLATLAFKAIGAGDSTLVPTANSIADSAGSPLSVTLQPTSINIVASPEPNTFVLLVVLVPLLAWRFNRSRNLRLFFTSARAEHAGQFKTAQDV